MTDTVCQHDRIMGRVDDFACRACGATWPRVGHGIPAGPGTALYAKLAGYGLPPCDDCKIRAFAMDLWGPDGCARNIKTITQWIRWEATRMLTTAKTHTIIAKWLETEGIIHGATKL